MLSKSTLGFNGGKVLGENTRGSMIRDWKMKKIIVGLLLATLMTWVPCPCLGRCLAPGDCAQEVAGASCCHPNCQQGGVPSSPKHDCCCDQGICKPAVVAGAKVQKIESAQLEMGNIGSPIAFECWEPESKNWFRPSLQLILPGFRIGYPFPEFTSLLI